MNVPDADTTSAIKAHLPDGWSRSKVKFLGAYLNGFAFKPESWSNEGAEIIRIQNLTSDDPDKRNYFDGVLDARYRIRTGDLLISWSATLGVYVWLRGDAWLNQHIFKVRVEERVVSRDYFRWLAHWFLQRLEERSHGSTMQHLTKENFGGFRVVLPSKPQQGVISQMLDRETARIDTLIDKQKKLIELLKEKRQAVISQAVTKGLDPDVPMKDSGVEWLGEVPAHWTVAPLKFMSRIQTGIAKGKDTSDVAVTRVPYMRVANVQDGYIDLSDVSEIEMATDAVPRYRLQAGDVLMNEGGDYDKLGRGAVWSGEIDPCVHQNHVFAIRPTGIEPEWLALVAESDYLKFYFMGVSKQSTNLASISSRNLMQAPITSPAPAERARILDSIDTTKHVLDKAVRVAAEAIDLLHERRIALITAAVTGQIDATNYVPVAEHAAA